MWLRQVRIGQRLIIGFGVLALVMLMQGGFGLRSMSAMQGATQEITRNWIPSLNAIGDLNLSLMRYRVNAVRLVIDTDPSAVARAAANLSARAQEAEAARETYAALITEPEERRIFTELTNVKDRYMAGAERVKAAMEAGDQKSALSIIETEQNPLADQMTKLLLELGKINREGATASAQQSEDAFNESKTLVITSILIALAITLALAMVISRSIVIPLHDAVQATKPSPVATLSSRYVLKGAMSRRRC